MVVIGGGKSSNLCSGFFFCLFLEKKPHFSRWLFFLLFSLVLALGFRVWGIGQVDDPNKGGLRGKAPQLSALFNLAY